MCISAAEGKPRKMAEGNFCINKFPNRHMFVHKRLMCAWEDCGLPRIQIRFARSSRSVFSAGAVAELLVQLGCPLAWVSAANCLKPSMFHSTSHSLFLPWPCVLPVFF